jgi:hypothetical protein
MELREITKEALKEILKKHLAWLNNAPEGEKANLSYANLRSADFSSANLSYADFSSANLSYADFSSANLSYANLSYANLSSADFSYANLSYADFSSANLSYANLSYANLSSADFSYANLRSADFSSANLDFSSGFSFRCSSFNTKIDIYIGAQMAYHFCRMVSEDPEVIAAQQSIKELANKFHRVDECGRIQ